MQHAGENGLQAELQGEGLGRWLLQGARQEEQAGEVFEQGQRDGFDFTQRCLSERSELFKKKGNKTVPGPKAEFFRVKFAVFLVPGKRKQTCSSRIVFLVLHSWSGLFVDPEMRVVE